MFKLFTGSLIFVLSLYKNLFTLQMSGTLSLVVQVLEYLHKVSIMFSLAFVKKHTEERFKTIHEPGRMTLFVIIVLALIIRIGVMVIA